MAIQDILVFRPADGAFAKWYSDGSVGPAFNFQEVGYIGGFPRSLAQRPDDPRRLQR